MLCQTPDGLISSFRYDIVDRVFDYLRNEMKDKKGEVLDEGEWSKNVPEVPQQKNGFDCGVFACKFGEYASRYAPIDFSQQHMPYFRRRMIWEIVNGAFYKSQ